MSEQELKETPNSREYKMLKKQKNLSCSMCPPHRRENAKRIAKHGAQKARSKKHK